MTSPYLQRRLRSLPEFLAQRHQPHARLAEVHTAIDRAETELRKIGDEFSLLSHMAEYAYEAADMLDDWRADYLKPVDDELKDIEG